MYLYLIGAFDYNDDVLAVKIGVSDDVGSRIAALQTGQFCELKLLLAWKTESRAKCFRVERSLHDHYRNRRMRGEWFRRMALWDIVAVTNDLMGSIACDVPGVESRIKDVRDSQDRRREQNRRRRQAKKAGRAAAAAA